MRERRQFRSGAQTVGDTLTKINDLIAKAKDLIEKAEADA